MFYCNKCAVKNMWPKNALTRSNGPCEICDKSELCNDVPSHFLGTFSDYWKKNGGRKAYKKYYTDTPPTSASEANETRKENE